MTSFIVQSFIFAYIWGIGGNIIDTSREIFDLFVFNQMGKNPDAKYKFINIYYYFHSLIRKNIILLHFCRLPSSGDLWNFYINVHHRRMDLWIKLMPIFTYNNDRPFFEILVPTIDTVRFGYIIRNLINAKKPVFVTGLTGLYNDPIFQT